MYRHTHTHTYAKAQSHNDVKTHTHTHTHTHTYMHTDRHAHARILTSGVTALKSGRSKRVIWAYRQREEFYNIMQVKYDKIQQPTLH